jgi:hypothetical protein
VKPWLAFALAAALAEVTPLAARSDGGTIADAGVPLSDAGLGFGPGEALSYAVTYLGASAGSARIEVGSAAPKRGVTTWPVVVTATSAGLADKVYQVRDRYVDWWDPQTGRAVESGLSAFEGGHRSGFHIRFQRDRPGPDGGVAVETQVWGEEGNETSLRVLEPDAQDVLSAIFWLRKQRLALGDSYSVPIFMGRKEWPLGASVIAKESVPTPLGPIPCVHLRLSASFKGKLGNRRDLDAYFSEDPRHLPVLLESEAVVGRIRVSLIGVLGDTPGVSH